MTRAGRMVTRWRTCNINQRSASKKSRNQGNSSVWKEELAPQEGDADFGRIVQGVPLRKQQPARKKGRVSVLEKGGGHISWDPGVQRGTIGRVVLADPRRREKGESPRGRIQEGANKTAGGRLMKARLNGSMADRIGRTGRTRRH